MVCEVEQQNVADTLALVEQNEAQQEALAMEQMQLQWAHNALMAQLFGAYQLLILCLNNSQQPEAIASQDAKTKVPSFTEWLEDKRKQVKK